jgi:hypothetical protein
MSLEQYCIPAITKTTGVTTKYTQAELESIQAKHPEITIYFGLDNDKAGIQRMFAYASDLYNLKFIRFVSIEGYKDWNELIVALQKSGLNSEQVLIKLEETLAKALTAREYYQLHAKDILTNLLKFTELNLIEDKEVEYFVYPLIVKNGINLLSAPPASFKSYLSLDLVISCITGRKFLDLLDTKPLKLVLLIDQENPSSEIKKRIRLLSGNISNFFKLEEFIFFDKDPEIKDKLINTLKLYPDSILVIDTLRRVNYYMDENSSLDINKFMAILNELKKYTTILLLHHTVKYEKGGDATTYRGSSDIQGAIDSAISLKVVNKSRNSIRIEIAHTKARFVSPINTIIADYNISDDTLTFSAKYKDPTEDPVVTKTKLLGDYIAEAKEEGRSNESLIVFGNTKLQIGEKKVNSLRDSLIEAEKIVPVRNFQGKKTFYFLKNYSPQQRISIGDELLS